MNHSALRLAACILLGLASAGSAGPLREAPAAVGADAAGAPSAALGRLEAGDVPALGALGLSRDDSAAFIRAAAAEPGLLDDAGVRAEAERALGASGVARLLAASASLRGRAGSEPAVARLLSSWRRQARGFTASHARLALSRVAAETAGWTKTAVAAAGVSGAFGRGPAPLAKPARRLLRSAAAGLAMTAGVLAAPPAYSDESAPTKVAAADVQEMVDNAVPSAQIYLVGRPRIKGSVIDKILADVQGKPYVVVIVSHADADGNLYKDKTGQVHTGLDAVETAAEEVVLAQSAAVQARDARTGERQAAVLVVVLDKEQGNQIVLEPSEQMRAHGVRAVDSDARYAVGSDAEQAVRTAVAKADSQVEAALASELQLAQSDVAAAKKAVDALSAAHAPLAAAHPKAAPGMIGDKIASLRRSVKQAQALLDSHKAKDASKAVAGVAAAVQPLTNAIRVFTLDFDRASADLLKAGASVDALEKGAGAFLAVHADAKGDLAKPDIVGMRKTLEAAKALLETDPAGAEAALAPLLRRAGDALQALADFPGGRARLDAAGKRIAEMNASGYAAAAKDDLAAAKTMLEEASALYADGASAWDLKLKASEGKLEQAQETAAQSRAAWTKLWVMSALGALLMAAFAFVIRLLSAPRSKAPGGGKPSAAAKKKGRARKK